jgi:hypothetical protein
MSAPVPPMFLGRRLRPGLLVASSLLAAACGAAAPSAAPAMTPADAATVPAEPSFGPTDFASWTARQGFGGSSGLNEMNKLVLWMGDNPRQITVAMLDEEELPSVTYLVRWLEQHPPTACWAEYHATALAALRTLEEDYATVRAAVAAGKSVPSDLATSMAEVAGTAYAMPAPANCP